MQKINEKLRFKCGIYELFNLSNGKRYVGSSVNIYNRLHDHYYNLLNNKAHNEYLLAAWNKYSEDSFVYNILEFCDEKVRFEREQYYLDFILPEYNLTSNVIANLGTSPSEETREKISNTLKTRYKSGEITAYRLEHNWIHCYIYNIRTFRFEMECNCLADAVRMLTKAKSHSRKGVFDNVFLNRYIISPTKFEDLNSLVNYISEKFLVANSKWGKYIVIEKQNGSIKYYRELTHAAQENSSSKSTLSKHGDATKDNPYLITKSNSLFYYTNEYIPISEFKAVPIEKSLELSSGNIGESPTDEDNIEISTETKESVPSYSVDGDPLN